MTVDCIQALLIDEDEDNLTALPERLRHPFEQLGWQVMWTAAKDPGRVRELFAAPGAAYDLIVVDLPTAARDGAGAAAAQPGLGLIRDARERFPGAFVLVIVGGGEADRPDLFDEARRYGAHRVLRRYEFSVEARETSPLAVATAIHNHLLDAGTVAPIAVTYDEFDPDIQAFVHAVGEPTLCRLYARILQAAGRTTRNMSLGYIAAGYAGAAVCAVTATLENSGVRTHHVLKVSLDKEALEREAQLGEDAWATLRQTLLAKQAPPYPVGPVNGWYALAWQLQGGAMTLRDWLARGAPDAAVEDVFAALFTDGLGGVYADTAQEIDSPADLLRTPYHRQRRILHALNQVTPILTHPDGCRLPESLVEELTEQVTGFVSDGRIGGADAQLLARQRTYSAFSHGHLHGTNVLVYDGRHAEPTVIDASRFGYAHWTTDPARMAVDLLMHSVDPGVESLFFTGFGRWREVAARLGRLERLLDPPADRGPAMPDPAKPSPTRYPPTQLPPAQFPPTQFPPSAFLPPGASSIRTFKGVVRGRATARPEPEEPKEPEESPARKAAGDGTAAALAALNWLTGNLRAFCPGMSGESEYRAHAWEWHTALARCLLRSSYSQDVTVPKRALAIVAAYDQLVAAEASLPD